MKTFRMNWGASFLFVFALTACAPATPAAVAPTAQDPATHSAATHAAVAPTQPATLFATLAPTVTPQRQFTPTTSAHDAGFALATPSPVWVDKGQPITVELTNFAFRPSRMVAYVGNPITLRLRNLDVATPHLFEISGLGLSVVLSANEEKIITFTVEAPGLYEYTCPLETTGVNHAMAGMTGELWVEVKP
ncbi:MAG: cupredoxin domain-containing protein [Anaerolineales bacterium]|nr:cupredoxin domain-containing protein [Anaerolineales bacterium]